MTSIFHEPDTSVKRIQVVCSSNERRGYEKRSAFFVHPLFNGENEWPTQTHVVCRYDGESFSSIPIPLPIDYNSDTNTYSCYGIFCSAACVKAFMENNPVYSNALSMIWLKKIMCEVFDDFEDIVEAPPIDLLIKHGGELTIDQFRGFGRQKTRILTHRMPFFTCALAFELVKEYGTVPSTTLDKEAKSFKRLQRQKKKTNGAIGPYNAEVPENAANVPILSLIQPSTSTLPTIFEAKQSLAIANDHDTNNINTTNNQISFMDIEKDDRDEPSSEPSGIDTNPYSDLLPDTITLVPANVGNRWEIRGLKRPEVPLDIPAPSQQNTKPLFQDYMEQKSQQKLSPTDMSTIAAASESKPQKRRGRPKSTRTKPDSPKATSQGTLISFLKNK